MSYLLGTLVYGIGLFLGTFATFGEEKRYKSDVVNKKEYYIVSAIAILVMLLISCGNEWGLNSFIRFMSGGVLVAPIVTDLAENDLPNSNTAIFAFLTALFLFNNGYNFSHLFIHIVILIFFFILCIRDSMGFGDFKLLVPITLIKSPTELIDYWLIVLVLALVVAIPIAVKTKKDKQSLKGIKMAYGPYIIIGYFVSLISF